MRQENKDRADLVAAAVIAGLPAERTLHLLDVENLAGDPGADAILVRLTLARYLRSVRVARGDHVVIAANPRMAFVAKQAWSGALVRVARGKDGADLALLAEADPDWVAGRYGRVVIGSGDGIFTGLAWELRGRGLAVLCVSRPEALSGDLRRAASLVRPVLDLAA